MGNNGVKGIVLVALLVIVSLIIGSQISSNRLVSVGIVAAMVGAFVLLYMGKNAWWLIFLAPPVANVLPMLPRLPNTTSALLIAPAILGYWLLMWIMGYVRIRWNTLWFTDLLILLIFLYHCLSYYQHPVAFMMLGLDMDEVGGKEYVICVLGVLSYIAISCLPITFEQTKKILKYLFFITIASLCFSFAYGLLTGRVSSFGEEKDVLEAAQTTRFSLLAPLGSLLAVYMYASTPFIRLFSNPLKLLALLLGVGSVVIAGWRGRFIEFCFRFVFIAILKREFSVMIIMAVFAFAGLQLLSHERILEQLPYGMQRALCAIPEIRVKPAIRREVEASSQWRITMWEWALDPRTGYIRNYVWGDGFGQSKADISRTATATLRGTLSHGDQQSFASQGIWHSGWITTMHRLGIIGLGIIAIWQIQLVYLIMSMGRVYKKQGQQYFTWYSCLYISLCSGIIQYHLSAGEPSYIYNSFYMVACIKLFNCCARDKGLLLPFVRTGPYVPLAIQDIEHTGPVTEAK